MEFLPEFGLDHETRRYDEKMTASEPHPGFQCVVGADRQPCRADAGGTIPVFRCRGQPDQAMVGVSNGRLAVMPSQKPPPRPSTSKGIMPQ